VPYTTPNPSTVSAGDTFPASAYNIISADIQDHESRIKTGVESYTSSAKAALAGVATGTVVYDSTLGVFQSYTGSAWVNLQGTPPLLTTAQKTALGTPTVGTQVYDSTLGVFQSYTGSVWVNAQGSPPALTTAQKTALGTPATGTMVYDSTLGLLQTWNGSLWSSISGFSVVAATYNVGAGNVANTAQIVSFTSASQILLNGCFTSAYTNYRVIYRQTNITGITNSTISANFTVSGSAAGTSTFQFVNNNGGTLAGGNVSTPASYTNASVSQPDVYMVMDVFNPAVATAKTVVYSRNKGFTNTTGQTYDGTTFYTTTNTHDGIIISSNLSGLITGDIQVIGIN
jgi:hypothetical protein